MDTAAPVLLCAATKWEADPLAARWGLSAVTPTRFEGTVRGVSVLLLKTGMGQANVARALGGLADPTARAAVSIGFAGALQPKMASGDLVLDVQGVEIEIPQAAREIAARQKVALHFGRIAHTDVVLHRPEDKAALGRRLRCSAVDMESQAIRRWAEARKTPMISARVILDDLECRLPARAPTGDTLRHLLPFILSNASELPLMARLGIRQKRAMSRLSAFLEEFLPRL